MPTTTENDKVMDSEASSVARCLIVHSLRRSPLKSMLLLAASAIIVILGAWTTALYPGDAERGSGFCKHPSDSIRLMMCAVHRNGASVNRHVSDHHWMIEKMPDCEHPWSMRLHKLASSRSDNWQHAFMSGYPYPCMAYAVDKLVNPQGAIEFPERWMPSGAHSYGFLPVWIWWPGFLGNTAVYLLVLYSATCAFALTRMTWRLRKSRCPMCAHPLAKKSDHAICNECGVKLRSAEQPSQD